MRYQIIKVNEYSGNNFCYTREAKLFEDGHLEYFPEPGFDDEEEETECAAMS